MMSLPGQRLRRLLRVSAGSFERVSEGARRVRLVTYNVHGCVGTDGRRSAARVAEALAAFAPDVIALQELDVRRARSGREDQPSIIARALCMDAHFCPAFTAGDEHYGNALLSRYPLRLRRAESLPRRGVSEPRGAMWATLDVGGSSLQVVNTHLGLDPRERVEQVRALLGRRWVGDPGFQGPAVVCGDLNAMPATRAYRMLTARLRDAQRLSPQRWPQRTFPSGWPAFRIDHILVDEALRVEETSALVTPLTRVASDHLPLLATLVLP